MKTLLLKNQLLLFFIFISLASLSQNVNIPDPEFKQALISYSPRIDTNFDGQISVQEAQAITVLNISNHHRDEQMMPDPNDPFNGGSIFIFEGIYDFTGIEAFTNLTSLNCSDNDLTSLDVSALTQLTSLNCSSNINYMGHPGGLTSLILPNAGTLTQVNSSNNHLTSINLSANTSLTDINFSGNNINNLILPNTNSLTTLNVAYNQISNLNTSTYTSISSIICNNNGLTSLTLPNTTTLTTLKCYQNQLTNLDLTQNSGITWLDCRNNSLSYLILTQNIAITTLNCNSNLLTNLDLNSNTALTTVSCSNNQISTLDVSFQTNLNKLYCNNNQLTNLNIKNGNNSSITSNWFDARNNPNLNLICVDDIAQANSTFTRKDTQSYYSDICSFIPTNSNTITGTVSFDLDANGCDILDRKSINTKLTNTSTNTSNVTFTGNNGQYLLYTQEANNTLDIFSNFPSFFTVTPTTQNVNFTGSGATQVVDFCITANTQVDDVKVSILPITESRPGFQTTVRIFYENVGSTILSGDINLSFDDLKEIFIGASETVVTQTINSLSWNYTNLYPFEKNFIDVTFEINRPTDPTNPVNNGDVLTYNCTINPTTGDANSTDNTVIYNDITIGSYDPNDIIALEGNFINENQVSDFLNYRIRFQNTGTASAINIVVKNELDADLDWDSFQPITASHNYRISVTDDNKVDFIFENIHLADSTSNELGSHGWIYYKIKPKSTFAIGDVIENTANIYFDYNPPVITNTYTTQIEEPIIPEIPDLRVKVYPNPTKRFANIKVNLKGKLVVLNKYGVRVLKHRLKKGVNTFDFGWLRKGRYFLKIKSKKQVIHKKLIIKKRGKGHGHGNGHHGNKHGRHCNHDND
ncbi:MAG: T9SS type A sorting domain-containing protein [Polaribacter sp.]|uniref:DUF7619 domain-containing protein n=1 Tax=Polaribacter sp. TaxID=1920175 RepID=UPI002F357954